jgi:tRNA-dihydrouridine synthase B
MAGITDSPFRRIARRFGAGLLYTECLSAEGMRRRGRATLELARFHEDERPIALQLFGSDPAQMAEAAAVAAEQFHPDLMDINCGCPVKKFVTRGCGGYLMQDPDLIGRMVAAVREASGLPVSVKLRGGYTPPTETAPQAAIAAEESGAALVAVHGRYVRGAKGTTADWEVIGRVKAAVRRIPVVGNGDVRSYVAVRRMMTETGCDRVMIGRWAQGRPWIFKPLRDGEVAPDEEPEPSPCEKLGILEEHYRLMLEEFPERTAVFRMRKHIGWYIAGFPSAGKLRGEAMKLISAEEAIKYLSSCPIGVPNQDE